MALAHTKTFSVILLLSVGVAQGADAVSKESSDLLEEARRELQELQSVERSLEPSRRLPGSTLQLPVLTPAAPTAKTKEEEKTQSSDQTSQGWLLDGLKAAEARDRSRLRSASPNDRLSPEALRRKADGAPNPLNNYLEQWLAPQDRRLLGGEKPGQTALERSGIRDQEPFRPKANDSPKSPFLNSDTGLGMPSDRVNPYLTGEPAEDPSFTPPFSSISTSPVARPHLSRSPNSLNDQPSYPPNGDTVPTLGGSTKTEALPPPTAPLLDERRYFPQLRRF